MKTCAHHEELLRAIRAGHWPHGIQPELRDHVAACAQCNAEANMLTAFAAARTGAMQTAPSLSPGLLWWKAQLRRRREAMERIERPGFAISTATLAASTIILLAVLAAVWKRVEWSRLSESFSSTGWNPWIVAAMGAALCGLTLIAVFVSVDFRKDRR